MATKPEEVEKTTATSIKPEEAATTIKAESVEDVPDPDEDDLDDLDG